MCPALRWALWGQTEATVLTPQRACCLQGALTEQKKPYGSVYDKLRCVMWLLSGPERREDSFLGRRGGVGRRALMASAGWANPLGLTGDNNLSGPCEVKRLG